MAERTQMTSSQFDVEVAELILKSGDQPDEVERYEVARLYAMRGDRDRAFVWLERSENEEGGAYNFVRSDPFLRSLHDDPRWEPFLRKVYGRSRE